MICQDGQVCAARYRLTVRIVSMANYSDWLRWFRRLISTLYQSFPKVSIKRPLYKNYTNLNKNLILNSLLLFTKELQPVYYDWKIFTIYYNVNDKNWCNRSCRQYLDSYSNKQYRQKFSQCIPIKTKDPWFFNVSKEYRKGTLA